MSGRSTNGGASCTEIKFTVVPSLPGLHPFESVALVPGDKTVVTTLRLGEEARLDADKFALGEAAVKGLLLRLGSETESYLNQVS
jgi:hypothetical protein